MLTVNFRPLCVETYEVDVAETILVDPVEVAVTVLIA
jgi:hypothetical protein